MHKLSFDHVPRKVEEVEWSQVDSNNNRRNESTTEEWYMDFCTIAKRKESDEV